MKYNAKLKIVWSVDDKISWHGGKEKKKMKINENPDEKVNIDSAKVGVSKETHRLFPLWKEEKKIEKT